MSRRSIWLKLASILASCAAIAGAAAYAKTYANINSPTGTHGLIMVDKVGGYIRFFDPVSDKELSSFELTDASSVKPHELAISADHKTAYVTVYGDGVYGNNPHPGHTVAIIDLGSQRMVGSIDVSPYRAPHGIQIDPSGKLYVACDLDRKVLIHDPKKRAIEGTIDVEGTGHWIALVPSVGKLYVANKNDRLFIGVVDLKTRKLVGKIPMPNGTQHIVASPDGKTLLAADLSEPYLHVMSTATDTEVEKIQLKGLEKGGLYKMFYSPDGKRMLTCLLNGQINIFDAADLRAPQQTVQSAGTALMGIAFSSDGKTILVGNHGQGTVSRIDLQNATLIDTFAAGKGVETLEFY